MVRCAGLPDWIRRARFAGVFAVVAMVAMFALLPSCGSADRLVSVSHDSVSGADYEDNASYLMALQDAAASHHYVDVDTRPISDGNGLTVESNSVVVSFDGDADGVAAIVESLGGVWVRDDCMIRDGSDVHSGKAWFAGADTVHDIESICSLIESEDSVLSARPNVLSQVCESSSGYPEWSESHPGKTYYDYDAELNAHVSSDRDLRWNVALPGFSDVLDDYACNGKSVVAVIDSGHYPWHQDIDDNVVLAWNGVRDELLSDSYLGDMTSNHGAMTSGVISAEYGNGFGIDGCSGDAGIMVIECGLPDEPDAVDGYAVYTTSRMLADMPDPPDVVNMSFGNHGDGEDDDELIRLFNSANIVCVAASGNEGGDVCYPAACDGCMAVTAHSHHKKIFAFSSHGDEVDVSAPSIVMSLCRFEDESGHVYSDYEQIDGTSAAAPHVSAAAAIIRARFPDMPYADVVDVIKQGAVDDLDRTEMVWGEGAPSSSYWGAGRLNIDDSMLSDSLGESYRCPLAGLSVSKVDADGSRLPQGDASFSGVRFEVSYYNGYRVSGLSDTEPVSSAIFGATADGVLDVSNGPVEGRWSFDYMGELTMPVGTIVVREVSAPDGYALNGDMFVFWVEHGDDGMSVRFMGTARS